MYASVDLIEEAVVALGAWRAAVHQQTSSHLYSFLAPKLKGAKPGVPLAYTEADDHEFWDRFFRVRDEGWPYFDPLKSEWRPPTQGHSNTATQRKGSFVTAWRAAEWDGEILTLAPDYAQIVVGRVLTKKKKTSRVPARALAIWLFKFDDLPETEDDLVQKFKDTFHFANDEFAPLFDAET